AAKLNAAIERTLDVIGLVLNHHIDPPTRPEILRKIGDNLDRSAGNKLAPEWAKELADTCTNREASRQVLLRLNAELGRAIATKTTAEPQFRKRTSTS